MSDKKIEFENRASKGFRLATKYPLNIERDGKRIEYIEIGATHTSPKGDILLEEHQSVPSPKYPNMRDTYAKTMVFPNQASLEKYLKENYGETNVAEFTPTFNSTLDEMKHDKYDQRWKRAAMKQHDESEIETLCHDRGLEYVHGYKRGDGTYIKGHCARKPERRR